MSSPYSTPYKAALAGHAFRAAGYEVRPSAQLSVLPRRIDLTVGVSLRR
jgi:hypothetical protein